MKLGLVSIVGAMVLLVAPAASASTISFASQDGQFYNPTGLIFSDNGFQFSYAQVVGGFTAFGEVGNPAGCTPACSSNGVDAFYSFNSGALTMNANGNAPFSLLSFDAAQTFTGLDRSLDLDVIGTLQGGGTVTFDITTLPGGADTFSTYTLPGDFTDLVSVEFVGADTNYPDGEFAIDNIDVSGGAAVPEPGTLALFGMALLALGGLGLRRKFV